MKDPRRWRVIRTDYRRGAYTLTIDGRTWATVGWDGRRRAWVVRDAKGYPPPHLDLSQSENVDRETAVRLARQLIRNGSLPIPELAGAHFKGSVSPATIEDVTHALEAAEAARQAEALPVGVARSGPTNKQQTNK
jgi:hypothetical protein